MSAPRPPRLASRLLDRFVPADAHEGVVGDLEEVYRSRRDARGRFRANAWFWGQAISFSVRFGLERIRDAVLGLGLGDAATVLDLKLAFRMLVKSPLLTVTGCVAIATAIGVNAGFSEFLGDLLSLSTTVETDERVVALVNDDTESGARETRVLEDVARWRAGLETVEEIGVVVNQDLSLVGPEGSGRSVDVGEMSASGFRLTEMVPAAGRPFVDADDGPAAEPVAVLSHATWEWFGRDPDIVGASIQVGGVAHRVVGVAAEGYNFPRRFDLWINLRRDLAQYAPRTGPGVIAFGALAPGRTLEEAEQEIDQLGLRASMDMPRTHERLRARVLPFSESVGISPGQLRAGLWGVRSVLVLLLIVACANIATLVFARNVGRESEIAVRHALGARRARIVGQLFIEALVLALVSAAIGLAVADWGLRTGSEIFWEVQRTEPPFGFEPGLSLATVLYSLGLAALGAGVVGVLPGLRATGRRAEATLRRAGQGMSALSFGRLPTAVIVLQTTIAVALIPITIEQTVRNFREGYYSVRFPADAYMTGRFLVDTEVRNRANQEDMLADREVRSISIAGVSDGYPVGPTLLEQYREMRTSLGARIRSEPGVRAVAFSSRLPGLLGQSIPAARLEVDGQPPRDRGWYVRTTTADLGLFEITGSTVLDGRGFTVADYGEDQRVALVNQAFVEEVLEGRSAVGQLVRDFEREGDPGRAWTEIVGVVSDDMGGASARFPQIYFPLSGLGEYPMRMIVEVDGDPAAFGPRLRAVTAEAHPELLVDEVLTLGEIRQGEILSELFFVGLFGFIALVTILLATSGIYALMSFIVAQRTREIGIRTALGAAPARVVRGLFLRTAVQLGLGVILGLVMVTVFGTRALDYEPGRVLWMAGVGVSIVLFTVGTLGCVVPVRRALSIQPTEALSADG